MDNIVVKGIEIQAKFSHSQLASELTAEIKKVCPEGYHYKETIYFRCFEYGCNAFVIYEKD